MATAAQIFANRKNAERSTGPTSVEGLRAIAANRLGHGLCSVDNFTLIADENREKFDELLASLGSTPSCRSAALSPFNVTRTVATL